MREDLWEKVEKRADKEKRSVANMFEVLVTEALTEKVPA